MLASLKNKGLMLAMVALVAMLGVINPAMAQVDVTEVVAEIGSAVGPIGLIGGAVLLVLVTIKVYKWVRRAM